jgi:hypothetical protein
MCKRGGLLIAYDYEAHHALITDADCDTWKCDECRVRLRDKWLIRSEHGARVLMEKGNTLYFATITSHEANKTFNACARVFPCAWGKLHKRLNRSSVLREYLLTPERHKDGRLHMHAIWTYPVKTRWLKDEARACGFGYMNQIGRRGHVDEAIENPHQVAEYLAKYLTKQLGDDVPARFRRVRVSAGWADVPKPENEYTEREWHYIGGNGALQSAYEECSRARLTMVDIRTGEIFEDVDLGTIVATNYA